MKPSRQIMEPMGSKDFNIVQSRRCLGFEAAISRQYDNPLGFRKRCSRKLLWIVTKVFGWCHQRCFEERKPIDIVVLVWDIIESLVQTTCRQLEALSFREDSCLAPYVDQHLVYSKGLITLVMHSVSTRGQSLQNCVLSNESLTLNHGHVGSSRRVTYTTLNLDSTDYQLEPCVS